MILHGSLYIGKVEVDDSGLCDKIGNTSYRLLKNLVCFFKRIRHGSALINYLKKLIVGNNDKSINIISDLFDSALGVHHPGTALKSEGLCHNADGKDPHILGKLCDIRSSTCTGTTAHSAGNKHHICAFKCGSKLLHALFGSLLSNLGLGACAETFGELFSYLYTSRSLAQVKRLLIGVNSDEFNSAYSLVDHTVNCVISGSADADNYDLCFIIRFNLSYIYRHFMLPPNLTSSHTNNII